MNMYLLSGEQKDLGKYHGLLVAACDMNPGTSVGVVTNDDDKGVIELGGNSNGTIGFKDVEGGAIKFFIQGTHLIVRNNHSGKRYVYITLVGSKI